MCGNTRPKLLEISYGKTSQQKGEVSYGKTSQQRTLHIPREMPHTLLTYIPPLPLPQTAKTETYEDKDRRSLRWNKAAVPYQLTTTQEGRRRWQTKTDEDEDRRRQLDALWGGAKRQLPFSWRLPRSDEDEGRRRRRQTKTKADEGRRRRKQLDALWGGAKRQLPFSWRLPKSDEDGTWYLTSHAIRWLQSPWRMYS